MKTFLLFLTLFSTALLADEEVSSLISNSMTPGVTAQVVGQQVEKDSRGTKWIFARLMVDGATRYSLLHVGPPLKLVRNNVLLSDVFHDVPEDVAAAFASFAARQYIEGFRDVAEANAAVIAQRTVNPSAAGPAIFADALEDAGVSQYYPPISPASISNSGTDYGTSVSPNVFYVALTAEENALVLKFPSEGSISLLNPTPNWKTDQDHLPAAVLAIAPVQEGALDNDNQRLDSVITGLKFRLKYSPYINSPSSRTKILQLILDAAVAKRSGK